MQCARHPKRASRFVCADCAIHVCDECVKIRIFGSKKIQSCPKCGLPLIAYAAPENSSVLDRAKRLLSRAHRADIRPPEVIMLDEARAARQRREQQRAVNLFVQALTFSPGMTEALEDLFALLIEMGDIRGSTRTGMELIAQYLKTNERRKALATYRLLVKADPTLDPGAEALWTLGQWFHDARFFSESATAFRKLGVLHPEHALAAHALFRSAFIMRVELGHDDQARKTFQYVMDHYADTEWATRSAQEIARMLE